MRVVPVISYDAASFNVNAYMALRCGSLKLEKLALIDQGQNVMARNLRLALLSLHGASRVHRLRFPSSLLAPTLNDVVIQTITKPCAVILINEQS